MKKQFLTVAAAALIAATSFAATANASPVSAMDWPAGWENTVRTDSGISGFDGNAEQLENGNKETIQPKSKKARK